jgi:hypothetical protein
LLQAPPAKPSFVLPSIKPGVAKPATTLKLAAAVAKPVAPKAKTPKVSSKAAKSAAPAKAKAPPKAESEVKVARTKSAYVSDAPLCIRLPA